MCYVNLCKFLDVEKAVDIVEKAVETITKRLQNGKFVENPVDIVDNFLLYDVLCELVSG